MLKTPKSAKKRRSSVAPADKKEFETCPSAFFSGLPSRKHVENLRFLTSPHVDSYNYFLNVGLAAGVKDLDKYGIDLVDPKKIQQQAATPRKSAAADSDYENIVNTAALDDIYKEVPLVEFWIEYVRIGKPVKPHGMGRNDILYPRECRERKAHYSAPMTATFCYQVVPRRNGQILPHRPQKVERSLGNMPIMVMSEACRLHNLKPAHLVKLKEEDCEAGGYFILGGNERCVRLLQVPRRNYATAIQRSSYKKRGNIYSDLGVAMRCSRYNGDESCITNTLHYLNNGGITVKFLARKQEFLLPVILLLRALSGFSSADVAGGGAAIGATDEELYRRIIQDDNTNTFLVARAGLLLQDARARFANVNTPEESLAYIGNRFRNFVVKPESTSDIEIGHYIIDRFIMVHMEKYSDKLDCLLFMIRKLYAFAAGDCGADSSDSFQNQEILMPGHLISTLVKEKLDETLLQARKLIMIDMRKDFGKLQSKISDPTFWGKLIDRASAKSSGGIGNKVQKFLSTGNLVTSTGLDLMQVSGYTIVAERLNFLRYCAHFRSVHRGQFFMEMKTTAVRKLLPDQWGFLCPVHTPDGGPCGLLSHLALKAIVLTHPAETKSEGMVDLTQLLYSLGVTPSGYGTESGGGRLMSSHLDVTVAIDGRIVGGASASLCKSIATYLRSLKVQEPPKIPPSTEVGFIPIGKAGSPYPGLYIFTKAARMVRPVLQRDTGKVELIGPLEQSFMDVACLDEDVREGVTTHQELDPTNMLSLIANLTPFSDQNQSPRNMYQCQMGKQTMGTPCHSLPYRTDNKLYRILNPQAPLVQTAVHGQCKMDEYPNGTNAVVAVVSYTGYDMEDSVILNKSSLERGFGHGSVYKTVVVKLEEEKKMFNKNQGADIKLRFANKEKDGEWMYPTLEADGLPKVGTCLEYGDPIYCIVDGISGNDKVSKHKDREVAYVQSVRAVGSERNSSDENIMVITLRYPRYPIIGDKFSSRHGQKGVCSITWPQEDMPFSESGISPDVIINPHAFPSRMTIGMLVESMAGKSGAMHGFYQDATPFTFHESGDKVSVDYFGEQLQAAGYNYYGSEALYSGVSGCVLQADLYIGVVYYQRLRHMVSDKYQVRATGPYNELTRQPVKGRKKGGGIRLGEMERDSLLSHGTAFLLQDRLLNCSDKHIAYVCTRCGDMLMTSFQRSTVQTTGQTAKEVINRPKLRQFCRSPECLQASQGQEEGDDEAVEPIVLPYVYRYLVNELAAMNIRLKIDVV